MSVAVSPVRRRLPGRLWRVNFFAALGVPGVVFVTIVFVVPTAMMLAKSVTDPGVQNYVEAFQSGIFRQALWVTVRMAVVVTVLCIIVSYPYAYVLVRGGKALRIALLVALMVSFWTSSLVRTYAWQILLNDTGLVNEALLGLGVVDAPLSMIRTDFAVYVGMAHVLAPFTILTLYAQMRGIPRELEQAAQSLGARPSSAFLRVTLPLSLPGAAAGGVLAFVIALGFYITPQLLGSARQNYVGTAVVNEIEVFLRPGVGAAESVVLLVVALLTLGIVGRFVGIKRILGIGGGAR